MTTATLQVTYREGKPWAAYLSIGNRTGRTVAVSRERGPVVVDLDADSNVLGFELHTITADGVDRLKQELTAHHLQEVSGKDLRPLLAA